jgi:hypothetical protein
MPPHACLLALQAVGHGTAARLSHLGRPLTWRAACAAPPRPARRQAVQLEYNLAHSSPAKGWTLTLAAPHPDQGAGWTHAQAVAFWCDSCSYRGSPVKAADAPVASLEIQASGPAGLRAGSVAVVLSNGVLPVVEPREGHRVARRLSEEVGPPC